MASDLSSAVEAYAAYLNATAAARENLSPEEFELFEEDKRKAHAEMLDLYYRLR